MSARSNCTHDDSEVLQLLDECGSWDALCSFNAAHGGMYRWLKSRIERVRLPNGHNSKQLKFQALLKRLKAQRQRSEQPLSLHSAPRTTLAVPAGTDDDNDGQEGVVEPTDESDEPAPSNPRRASAYSSVRLPHTTLRLTAPHDSSAALPIPAARSSTQLLGVFPSPSFTHVRWKVVRETLSSEKAAGRLDEFAGSETALSLFSPVSHRRPEEAEVEIKQPQQHRVSQLHSELQAADAVRHQLQQQVRRLTRELAERSEQQRHTADQHHQQVEQLEDEVKEQQADVSRLESKLVDERAGHVAKQQHLQRQHDEAHRRQAAVIADTAEQCAQSEANLQAALHRLEALHAGCRDSLEELQSMRTRLTELQTILANRDEQQRTAAAQHRQQIEQLEDELKGQQEEERNRRQAEASRLERELAGERAVHADKQQQLQCQLEDAQQRHAAVQAEAAERYARYEADLQATQRRLDEQLLATAELEKDNDKLLRGGAKLYDNAVALQAELATVREQLAASQAALRAALSQQQVDTMHGGKDEVSGETAADGVSEAHAANVAITPTATAVAPVTSVSLTASTSAAAQSKEGRDTGPHSSHQFTISTHSRSPSGQPTRKRQRPSEDGFFDTPAAAASSSSSHPQPALSPRPQHGDGESTDMATPQSAYSSTQSTETASHHFALPPTWCNGRLDDEGAASDSSIPGESLGERMIRQAWSTLMKALTPHCNAALQVELGSGTTKAMLLVNVTPEQLEAAIRQW